MASIRTRKLKSGEPRYDVIWVNPSDGRQDTQTFSKKVHATRFKSTIEADMARGTYLDPNAGDITFREYAEDWLATRTIAITSRVRVEGMLRVHIYPVIGHLPLAKTKPSAIQSLVKSIDHLAPSTQEQVLKTASAVFAAAIEDERLIKNPCLAKSVSTARVVKKRVVPWTHKQVADMHRELPERYDLLTVLGGGLGLRQGETYGLSPDDIDSDTGWVTVRRQVRQLEGSKLHFALPKNEKVARSPCPR